MSSPGGTVLENLSGRKLSVLFVLLILVELVCFFVGCFLAPVPASIQTLIGTICPDVPGSYNRSDVWIYSRGDGRCNPLKNSGNINLHDIRLANEIVYVFQMPLPRDNKILDYSRWQQNLIGILHAEINQPSDKLLDLIDKHEKEMILDTRLAYKNRPEADNVWHPIATSLERRSVLCEPDEDDVDKSILNCDSVHLFQLGNLHHDFYLLNIRFPVDTEKKMNLEIGEIRDLHLTVIYQNGGFTKIWLGMKTIFLPIIIGILIWFGQRLKQTGREIQLIEKWLFAVGASLTLINLPVEYLSIWFDMPYMLLLTDVRQGIFYATLLSFWLIFVSEYLQIQDSGSVTSEGKRYWRHLSAVCGACVSLFLFDVCERGAQLNNPFYSIWNSSSGSKVAFGFLTSASICGAFYFAFLCRITWRVLREISAKRSAISAMSVTRRFHYEGIIYRFRFLLISTIICAAATILCFLFGQKIEGTLKWNENYEFEMITGLLMTIYGMWNVYIFALIVLYAPSHKDWSSKQTGNRKLIDGSMENVQGEEIEFTQMNCDSNVSEIAALTAITKKVAME